MSEKTERHVRIEFTSEQKELIKQASGQDCDSVTLTFDELEQRIAPSCTTGTHIPTGGITI